MAGVWLCDLDGTLAEWDGVWRGPEYIGPPIMRTVRRVKHWLRKGREVKIFTARVSTGAQPMPWAGGPEGNDKAWAAWHARNEEAGKCRVAIENWCLKNLGQVLPIVYEKDYHVVQILDDRALQCVPNTGAIVQEELRTAVVALCAIAATGDTAANAALISLDPWSQKLGS
jgi:hypothetical protein